MLVVVSTPAFTVLPTILSLVSTWLPQRNAGLNLVYSYNYYHQVYHHRHTQQQQQQYTLVRYKHNHMYEHTYKHSRTSSTVEPTTVQANPSQRQPCVFSKSFHVGFTVKGTGTRARTSQVSFIPAQNQTFRACAATASAAHDGDDHHVQYSNSNATPPPPPPPPPPPQHYHSVDGIPCVQITLSLPVIGPVSILEATAEAQETLVDLALAELPPPSSSPPSSESSHASSQPSATLSIPSGDPYGAVLWPSAYAVASYLLDKGQKDQGLNKGDRGQRGELEAFKGKVVVELGTGTGLVALVAIKAGAKAVLATDYEDIPLRLLTYAAENLNKVELKCKRIHHINDIAINSVNTGSDNTNMNRIWTTNKLMDIKAIDIGIPSSQNHSDYFPILQTALLDITAYNDQPLPKRADIIVAADIMYEPKTGEAMAHRVYEALQNGSRVVIGDSPGRPGRTAFLHTLHTELGLTKATFVDVHGAMIFAQRNQLWTVAIMDLDPKIHLPPLPSSS